MLMVQYIPIYRVCHLTYMYVDPPMQYTLRDHLMELDVAETADAVDWCTVHSTRQAEHS